MKCTFYGVCGSHPSISKVPMIRHTACVSIETDDFLVIFDAGSGIINLGKDIQNSRKPIFLVMSHFHYDHIIGLPYFSPLYNKNQSLTIIYPNRSIINAVLPKIFDSTFFPISFDTLSSSISVELPSFCDSFGFSLTPFELNHPGGCYGYRLSFQNKEVIYATDNQLTQDNIKTFSSLFNHCDLLIHDCYFFDEAQSELKSWGHTFLPDLLCLALSSNSKHLCLFHLKPDIDSTYLNNMKTYIDTQLKQKKSSLSYTIPYDGLSLDLLL